MALYRLHMSEWEAAARRTTEAFKTKTAGKRKQEQDVETDEEDERDAPENKKKKKVEAESFPGGGRKGISSGLSTVVKYHGKGGSNNKEPRAQQAPMQSVRTRKETAVEGEWWA
jgi:RNA exonuclease 4